MDCASNSCRTAKRGTACDAATQCAATIKLSAIQTIVARGRRDPVRNVRLVGNKGVRGRKLIRQRPGALKLWPGGIQTRKAGGTIDESPSCHGQSTPLRLAAKLRSRTNQGRAAAAEADSASGQAVACAQAAKTTPQRLAAKRLFVIGAPSRTGNVSAIAANSATRYERNDGAA